MTDTITAGSNGTGTAPFWAFPGFTRAEIEETLRGCVSDHQSMGTDVTYYLSGPMSSMPEFNFPFFQACKEQLEDVGFKVLSPHLVFHPGKPGSLSREEYLRGDLIEMLQHCDGIILLKGWLNSWGATFEFSVAAKLGYEILVYDERTGSICDGEELRQYAC